MKKLITLSLIILLSCGKDNDLKDYVYAGVVDESMAYYDLNPNVNIDFYVPSQFDVQINGDKQFAIGAIVVVPYHSGTAELSCERIDTTTLVDSHSNVPVFYVYAIGNVNPYDKNSLINYSGIWTDPSWASQIDISRGHGWTVGEKKYLGFRYRNENHHLFRKDNEYLYGWVGIIINDSATLSVDDYSYQED